MHGIHTAVADGVGKNGNGLRTQTGARQVRQVRQAAIAVRVGIGAASDGQITGRISHGDHFIDSRRVNVDG